MRLPLSVSLAAGLVVALAACDAAGPEAATANADGASTVTVPIAGSLPLCTGELVDFEGTFRIVSREGRFDGNGGYHSVLVATFAGSGSDQFGNTYRVQQTEQEILQDGGFQNEGGAEVLKDAFYFRLVGQGGAPSAQVKVSFHITFAATGGIAVENLDVRVVDDCP